MNLPITKKELDFIIELIRYKNLELYNKLWTYRFNLKNEDKKDHGLS
jgi:hypothetical protein